MSSERCLLPLYFFFNDTPTSEIYTLSLPDALPICPRAPGRRRPLHGRREPAVGPAHRHAGQPPAGGVRPGLDRSEEHTSELQTRQYFVCRLLLEKKIKYSAIRMKTHATTIHSIM